MTEIHAWRPASLRRAVTAHDRDAHGRELRLWPARGRAARSAPFCALWAALLLGGCVYRIPIQQGNFLDPVTIAQIKSGMTRSQVRYLLGTPMVPGDYDNSRWDYGYYLKTRRLQAPRRAHLTVYFTNELVSRVESDVRESVVAPLSARPVTSPEPR